MSKATLAAIAEGFATTIAERKNTEHQRVLAEVRAQKKSWMKAIKNGHTRKEILAKIQEAGYKISTAEFSDIIGRRRRKAKKAEASE